MDSNSENKEMREEKKEGREKGKKYRMAWRWKV